MGMEMGHVPMGQWEGGQAAGLIPACTRMCVTAGRVQAQKCGICCHRVFLFQCKLVWQLTQLSPSTCLFQSLSFHSTLYTQECTNLATLCSHSHSDNFAGDGHFSRLSPCFSPQASSHLLSSPLISPFLQWAARADPQGFSSKDQPPHQHEQ